MKFIGLYFLLERNGAETVYDSIVEPVILNIDALTQVKVVLPGAYVKENSNVRFMQDIVKEALAPSAEEN